jgi:Mn2+/Fe2+ NRAMP family transporter
MLVLACGVIATGINPILVTEYAVIFSAVALPLTYLPILLVANDRAYMREHANGRLANVLGVFYLVIILGIAVAAIPLMLLTNMGQG